MCPFPSSLSPCLRAGLQPGLRGRPRGSACRAGWSWPSGQCSSPSCNRESRALPACHSSRMQKSHVPRWGQNSGVSDHFCISPARRLEGKSWKITKSPYHHTGAPQSHHNDKLGLSILSQGLCVRQDGEAKGCCSLKALNCSLP